MVGRPQLCLSPLLQTLTAKGEIQIDLTNVVLYSALQQRGGSSVLIATTDLLLLCDCRLMASNTIGEWVSPTGIIAAACDRQMVAVNVLGVCMLFCSLNR